MPLKLLKNTVLLFVFAFLSCANSNREPSGPIAMNYNKQDSVIVTAALRTEEYLPILQGKKVGLVANQTSVIKIHSGTTYTHLVDSLLQLNIDISKVFAPEHGFRGKVDAGEFVEDGVDTKTGVPIVSLYGKNKKPSKIQLEGLDLVIFDIQDVGVRFYTYISTLHLVMEACAESRIPLIVLDRPNPHIRYVDGPVLESEFRSFVGMHPVPVVYGLTIGEYAGMINGEYWLADSLQCSLKVIPVENYTRRSHFCPPVAPSPNLPNCKSVELYPSLCFFEGTRISIGRGTDFPFQVYGHPDLKSGSFIFVPEARENAAKNPKLKGEKCIGFDLREADSGLTSSGLNLNWLLDAFEAYPDKNDFFTSYFYLLSGTKSLREQIESGMDMDEIRNSWKPGIQNFLEIRKKYTIYPEK